MECQIEVITKPPVKLVSQVERDSGRKRPQIENQIKLGNLDYAYMFKTDEYKGIKVILDNDKLTQFLNSCKERDAGRANGQKA